MLWATLGLFSALLQAQEPVARFGTTVVKSAGFRGDVYLLHPGTQKLPNFRRLRSVGSIYATALNVPPTNFTEGFPGVTGRFEWFAIDYTGRFWIEQPGRYGFALLSDDGSRLYIDGHLVIDNDGVHAAQRETGHVTLKSGFHQIRVSYFQGPRFHVALILSIAAPGEDYRVFDADEFLPPPDRQD
jgi:PA14 domain-containing protein